MNISMGKNWFIFLVASLVLIGVTGPANAADVRQIRPTTRTINPTKTTVQATVRSVAPNNPVLTAGGSPVKVTVSGTNLDLITSVQILLNSKIVSNVAAQLGVAAATSQGTSPARDMESKADLAKRSSDVTDRLGKRLPDSRPSGTVMIDTVPLPEKPASGQTGSRLPDRLVTLTAQSGAPAGNYQVRIIAGSQTINLSTDVLTVVVKAPVGRAAAASGKQTMAASRIQSSPTAPSPSTGSSGSGDGVTGMSPPPSQLGTMKQPSGSAGQQDGVPAQGSGAGSGNLTEIRGAATSQSSAPTDKASGRSVPSLTSPAGVPSRQLASSQAFKVRNMSPSGEKLQPREYQPTVNRVAMSTADVRTQRQAGTIGGSQFNRVISKVFSAARFDANSCGGTWEVRRITIDIPNTYYNNSTSLSRLDYELTDGEKESSQRKRAQDYARDIHIRISKIRACVDDWLSNNWTGGVEGGAFKVSLPFQVTSLVKTRAIERWDKEGPWIWTDRWDWNGNSADSSFPDYVLASLILDITLTPNITNGTITYSGVDARWNATGGDFQTPLRESYWAYIPKIIDFKGAKLEEIRQRAISLFNENSVRKRISDALTEAVLSNPYVNQVTALTGGSGGVVTYGYE